MGEFIHNMLVGIIDLILGFVSNTGGASESYLKFNGFKFGVFNSIWDITIGVAYGILAICFCYELNTKVAMTGGEMTPKMIAAPFLKLIMSVIVLDNAKSVMGWMPDLYDSWVQQGLDISVSAVDIGITDADKETIADALLQGAGILHLLPILLLAVLVFLVGIILKFAWNYKALMLKLELYFRLSVAPMAFADSFNGLSSTSLRYFKGCLALALYGIAFGALPALGANLMGSEFATAFASVGDTTIEVGERFFAFFNAALLVLVLPFAELGVLGAIKQVCKEAVG